MTTNGIIKLKELIFVPLLIFLAFSACSSLDSNSDYRDHISIVGQITMPDSVQIGSNISVSIATWGADGCWHKGRDVVKNNGNLFQITPYDQEYIGPDGCTAAIVRFVHELTLSPTIEGVQKIEVQTRFWGNDSVGTILGEIIVY